VLLIGVLSRLQQQFSWSVAEEFIAKGSPSQYKGSEAKILETQWKHEASFIKVKLKLGTK
jgi:hypothetical protein